MKTTLLNTLENPLNTAGRVARNAALTGLLSFAFVVPNVMADEEYEWDPSWGMHEEEWYDPSDWFNEDNQVNYEDYGYDDSYYSDTYWGSHDYYSDYAYDYNGYDPTVTGNDYYYQWSPTDQTWSEVSGDKSESDKMKSQAAEESKDKEKTKPVDKKDVMTMRGTIQSIGTAKTKDAGKDHTFIVLEPSSGKNVLVDFGPQAELDKIKLEKGNKIQVRGPRTKFGGKYVVVAQQVSAINSEKKDS